jgi:hypothetical protein
MICIMTNRSSSGSVVTRLQSGRPGFDSRRGQGFILFATASRPLLGPTQPLFPEVNQPGLEADHSPLSNADLRMRGALPPLPIRLHGQCLVKFSDRFIVLWSEMSRSQWAWRVIQMHLEQMVMSNVIFVHGELCTNRLDVHITYSICWLRF